MSSSSLLRPAFRTLRTARTPSRLFTTTSPKMTVTEITSRAQFQEVLAKNPLVILDASAVWCGPCKAISPLYKKWSDEERYAGKIHFAKFDIDDVGDLTQELGITSMPTFLFFKDGEKVDKVIGANPKVLEPKIEQHVAAL
ncbi:thioredoxin-like protein [Bombardia bombarda]|uniref:Thioredoxin-like protein n=1 Tax=Bombardia bombarda TaxID=252184 RepID=A0AA39XMK3_9PEZI|nr:thioredoxin-like protein [Bombardia bombarda]